MGYVMLIDLAICNGCHNCQIVCKDEHVGNDWTPIAKPQPDTGQFWHKVINMERGTFPKVMVTYHHSMCQHCEDAPCIEACPSRAIYRRSDGIVIIDPEKCRGNQLCIEACPYENVIYFNDDLNIAQKCTMCAHLLDQGWTETRCTDACPTGALTLADEDDPATKEKLKAAELLKPELKTRPRCTTSTSQEMDRRGRSTTPRPTTRARRGLREPANRPDSTGETVTTTSDNYGDFWLKNIRRAATRCSSRWRAISRGRWGPVDITAADRNVGDIELRKA
jgi:Fe-S-cluster-containing dehydrogenase component